MNSFTLSGETEACRARLEHLLSGYGNGAIAFSGGVDSTLLLEAASRIAGSTFIPVIAKSALNPESETASAVEFLRNSGAEFILIEADVFSRPEIISNDHERCFHCKKYIFSKIITAAAGKGLHHVFDGTHSEDLNDYRPGLRALSELGVISPLKDAGFRKDNIRELARFYGLGNWNASASPCLATRIPFGTRLNMTDLNRIEKGEDYLRNAGFSDVRLRVHGNIARIELPHNTINEFIESSKRSDITLYIRSLGFDFVTLDLDGYRTGSMNIIPGDKYIE